MQKEVNTELLKKIGNQQLKNEVERRIKFGEWRIETEYEDTYGDSSVRYTSSFSFPTSENERQFLEVSSLLDEQDKKDENKRQEEIKKDNNRKEVWEKMEGLVSFSIEEKGGWGSKNLIVECNQCGKMNEHVYLDYSKWKETNDIRVSSILSMIEYQWETHLVQGHNSVIRAWTEERQRFPKYEEWLKNRDYGKNNN